MNSFLITTCVVVAIVIVYFYSKLRVPKALLHLPKRPISDYLKTSISSDSLFFKMEWLAFDLLFQHKIMLNYRLGSWNVLISCPIFAKQMFKDIESFPKDVPSESYPERLFSKFVGEAVLFSNGAIWKRHRKVCNYPFKKQFEVDTFCKATSQFFQVVEGSGKGVEQEQLQVHRYMQRITIQSMGKDILGVDFDAVVQEQVPFIEAYNSVMEGASKPLPHLFPSLDTKTNPMRTFYFDQLQLIDNYFDEILELKKLELLNSEKEVSQLDLLSLLIKESQASQGEFTDLDIRNNVMTFLLAGHDTTAFALSSALHYLAEHPHIQEKARLEVLQVMNYQPTCGTPEHAKRPTLEQTKRMEYLTCVIKETMRMNPSVPRIPQRTNLNPTVVNGYTLPPNCKIQLDVYAMHHDPNNFKQPQLFHPERFLNVKDAEVKGYFPFGNGTRQCMGINFSMLEQKVVLSMILARYIISNSTFQLSSSVLPTPSQFHLKFELL